MTRVCVCVCVPILPVSLFIFLSLTVFTIKISKRDFPGGPVVKTPCFHWGVGSIPGRGTKIPHATRHGQEKKKKKDFQAAGNQNYQQLVIDYPVCELP